MSVSPDFANPPLIELVLGAQFSRLTKLKAGHFGRFWSTLGDEWTDPSDAPSIDEQFEVFDRPQWHRPVEMKLRLEPVIFPGRFQIATRDGDRMLQVQATRFHLNWRKRAGAYPSYHRLIDEFEAMFGRFADFVTGEGIGEVAINQWELTYVDAFLQGDEWSTPADWSKLLPGLFVDPVSANGLVLEHRAAEWGYEIVPQQGRLHISARSGRMPSGEQAALLLQMTARGAAGKGGAPTVRAGLDVGHRAAVETFLRVTSREAQQRWGR